MDEQGLSVNLSTVANANDKHQDNLVEDFIQNPIVATTDAIAQVVPFQFLDSARPWLSREFVDLLPDAFALPPGKQAQLAERGRA